MIRSLLFIGYHVLLCLAILALQGCSSFKTPTGALPWQKKTPEELGSDGQPIDVPAAIAKGINFERCGQYDKAREVYEKLLADSPHNFAGMHRMAVVADKQRRHPEAQALYTLVIQQQPNNAELFNDLGYSFFLDGQLPKAESAMAKAVQMDPDCPRFRNNLGMVMGYQGRMQEAFDQFGRAGSEADAHYNIAFIYAAQQKDGDAKLCFQRALSCDPTHAKASKALEGFNRFEQNDGAPVEEDFTADGRRLIPYIENDDGRPNMNAMANFGINHEVDSVMPGQHNIPGNREAGQATRSRMNDTRASASMANSRTGE